ncbi:hypothetical protein LTR56_014692 [Elasticomyces elasticus]|nr:hypothetical protein LTR56_014692 [Elasticomyces elasticus]KAK3636811.1 hypothetical protein LTR22_018564 [Elasticomyces elasticus]KAK4912515.1 hypothetical protein LTR49_019059 [Elasticomyces elasticus]KAK5751881.1 hypothetical protein LTS12_018059 [Elasticomyces elasticus]
MDSNAFLSSWTAKAWRMCWTELLNEISNAESLDPALTVSKPPTKQIAGAGLKVVEDIDNVGLSTTLFAFQRLGGRPAPLPEEVAKVSMRSLLEALDFFHTEIGATHCDIKLSNLMFQVEDESIFPGYEEAEKESPNQNKIINEERPIYSSRRFRQPRAHAYGLPVLCGFGEARIGSSHPWANIQPEVYRAPEILMQFEHYDCAINIWNLWNMLEADHLLHGSHEEGQHRNRLHMHEIGSLLSDPPSEFLRRSPQTWRLFDEFGIALPPR